MLLCRGIKVTTYLRLVSRLRIHVEPCLNVSNVLMACTGSPLPLRLIYSALLKWN